MLSSEHWCVLIKHNEGKINHSCQLYLDSLALPENKTRCNINKYNHGIHLSTNALCADYDKFFLLWSYLDQVLLANIMSQATSTFSPPWSPRRHGILLYCILKLRQNCGYLIVWATFQIHYPSWVAIDCSMDYKRPPYPLMIPIDVPQRIPTCDLIFSSSHNV